MIYSEAMENYSHFRDILWASLATHVNTSPEGSEVIELPYSQKYCSIAL